MRSTVNGIEFVFNNQTVLILLLLVKQFVGLICCHLTVHANPINSLFTRCENMSHGTSHGCLMAVMFVFRGRVCVWAWHL